MSRNKFFATPDDALPRQSQILDIPGFSASGITHKVYPRVETDLKAYREVLEYVAPEKGLDLEFKERGPYLYTPTIISVTLPDRIVSVPANAEAKALTAQAFARNNTQWIAHSGISADKIVIEQWLGIETPLDIWEDSMLTHYLCNQHLTKAPSKDDTEDSGALGFMNLWTMMSLVSDMWNWKECVRAGTHVYLADGTTERIEKLVKDKYNGNVLSVDSETGKRCEKKVTGWYKTSRAGRKFFRFGWGKKLPWAVVTGDHKVLTNFGWRSIEDANNDELIATGEPGISEKGAGLIAGMILGDGHLEKGRLRIFNELKQNEYLTDKRFSLAAFESSCYLNDECWHSISKTLQCFKDIDEDWIVASFDKSSLAIWFLDDGYRSKDNRCEIAAMSKSETLLQRLVEKMNTFGLFPNLRKSPSMSGYRIDFNREDSRELSKLVAPYAHPCVRYKLESDESVPYGGRDVFLCPDVTHWAPLRKEEFADETTETVYCLDVEDTHAFVTRGGVIHNCRGLVCDGPCPAHEPLGYCGVDSWAGIHGFQKHKEIMAAHGVPWQLYRDNMELAEICFKMEQQGVAVDLEFVKHADETADARKAELFPEEGLFNPQSPKQVVEWFRANGIQLSSNSKKNIVDVLEKEAAKLGFADISELEGSDEPLPLAIEQLHKLYEFKSEGKGLDPWFGSKYLSGSLVHPRFISVGTSTGRLSSSRPNFQNVPARGYFGDTVRKAIVARDPSLSLLKSDFANLELRICLLYADVDQKEIGKDAFTWLVQQSSGLFAKAAQLVDPNGYVADPAKAMRNIAKRIAHAGDYLEGIKILEPIELQKDRVKKMIDAGALRPYLKKYNPRLKEDWEFKGGIVCFTGVNLADSLFGEHSYPSRKKALEIQEDVYFNAFWFLREKFHIPTLNQIQETGFVKSKTGRFLKLSGDGEDQAKVAAAFLGQGTGADHVQAVMLRYYRETGIIPLLQVHDELVWEIPATWTDAQCVDFIRIMNEPTDRLPGFMVPSDIKRGQNWKEMKKLL